jgi:hypothetical protein
MKKAMKLSRQLRMHLKNCGMTMYVVSKLTGIDQSSLGHFRRGTRGLSVEAMDQLGELLGLTIVAVDKPKAARTSPGVRKKNQKP